MPDTPPPDDAAVLDKIRSGMAAIHQTLDTHKRNQHPKTHAVLQAAFQVHQAPPGFNVGIFAQPRCYAAWVRFSNGKHSNDQLPDIYGMAIKLLGAGVEGAVGGDPQPRSQDFVLADHPVFFARDSRDFLKFLELKGKEARQVQEARAAGKSPEELAELQRQLAVGLLGEFPALREFLRPLRSILAQKFFSGTPYRLGDREVKYFARPVEPAVVTPPTDSPDTLRDEIRQAMSPGQPPRVFEFGIEVRTNPDAMPLDDASVAWNSPESHVLATITFPAQEFESPARWAFGEALSFTPANALPEHEPLGSINAARAVAYLDSSITRHAATQTERKEPGLAYFNELTLQRFFDSFAREDFRGMQSCLHPDAEFQDIGFDVRKREVAAMWHMIVAKGIRVTFRDLQAGEVEGSAQWECDYEFRAQPDSTPHPVHNVIQSAFQFEGGLIRVHHDQCDFWKWFEQAMGLKGKALHLFDFLEDKLEQILQRNVPLDIEDRTRAAVRATARKKLAAFIGQHPEYA